MTQEQLAKRSGATKNYFSRIENNVRDIRLSTLMQILRDGFGGFNFEIEYIDQPN